MNAVMVDSELEISINDAEDSEIDEGSRKVIRQLVMKSRGKKAKTSRNRTRVVKKRKSTDEKSTCDYYLFRLNLVCFWR